METSSDISRKPLILLCCLARSMSTARLPMLLASSGIPVELFAPADERAAASAHLAKHTVVPRPFPEFAAALAERLRRDPPTIVIWGDDRVIEAAQQNHDPAFDAWWPADLARYPRRAISYKADFQEWAAALNLPVPRGALVENLEQTKGLLRAWGCEIIVKPSRGSGGMGIFRAATVEELVARWRDDVPGPWVVQEFLRGRNCILQYAARNGKLLMAASGSRVATNGPFGFSIRRQYGENPQATEVMQRYVEATGFTGLGGGDAIELADGSIRLVELTLRPTPGLHLLPKIGVPMDAIIRQMCGVEEPAEQPWTAMPNSEIWPLFPESLVSTLNRNLPFEMLTNLFHPNLWRGMTWEDPPIIRQGWRLSGQAFRSVFHRLIGVLKRIARGQKKPPGIAADG